MSGKCGRTASRCPPRATAVAPGSPVPPPLGRCGEGQLWSTDSIVTLPSLSTLAVMPMLCDGSSALLTVQFSVSPSGSTRTVRPPASQLVAALTIWLLSAAASICWLMFSSTSDTCTTLLSVVTWTLPLSSVCVTVNFTSWPSTVAVQVNVPPLLASTSAGQLTPSGATPSSCSPSCPTSCCASAWSMVLLPNRKIAPTTRPPGRNSAPISEPMIRPVFFFGGCW